MCWLYVPSLSAQESPDSILPSSSQQATELWRFKARWHLSSLLDGQGLFSEATFDE